MERLRGRWRGAWVPAALTWSSCAAGTPRWLPEVVRLYDAEAHVESARLYGNVNQYAYYFTDLLVGAPRPQRVSVIVDTGSSLCGFPCEGCEHCGRHLDPPFRIKESKSAQWLACTAQCEGTCQDGYCGYTQAYTEGSSISGLWFRDLVQLGDPQQQNPPVNATLGCHSDERKLFYTQRVNGIMGMAPHMNSGRPTILQDLFGDREHVNTGIFSMCLAEWGGRLSVGGYAPEYHVKGAEVKWIPLLHSGYYSVAPEAILIGEVTVASGAGDFGSALVDSGTTFTYFPTSVFNRLTAALVAVCTAGPSGASCAAHRDGAECWRLDDGSTDPSRFPTLSILFEGGVKVNWPPRAYLFQRGDLSLWCHAFADNGAEMSTVLGVSWMQHKDVIFDLQRSLLGVAEAACPEYRKPPGEHGAGADLGFSLDSALGTRKTAAFTSLLVFGIASSLVVAVGIMVWLVYTNCGAKSGDEDDEGFLPQGGRSRRGGPPELE